ncbi:MAG: hypothetical protein Q9173_006929 [Seirophora scorigena]
MDALSPTDALCREDNGPLLLGYAWALVSLAVLTVALRIFFRMRARKGMHSDDYFVMASLAVGLVGAAFLTKLVQSGGGQHLSCLPRGSIYPVNKWSLLAQVFNVIGIGLVKISVCLCVLRLIDRVRRRLSQFLWVLLAFVAVSHFVQVVIFLLYCRPLNALWDPKVKGTCLDALTDLLCAGIPIFVIHRIRMNTRSKVALCVLMSLGIVTAGCAIAKAITVEVILGDDYTWAILDPAIFTITEHYAGITIASMPALNPLFSKVLGTKGSSQGSSKRSFRKIESAGVGLRVPQAYSASERSSIPEDKIRANTDYRASSQLEFEVSRDREPSDGGALPDFLLRESGNSWAQGPDIELAQKATMNTGGYRHIDNASDVSSALGKNHSAVSAGRRVS